MEAVLYVKNPLINKESEDNEKNGLLNNELFDKYSPMYHACVGWGWSLCERQAGVNVFVHLFASLVGLVVWLAI